MPLTKALLHKKKQILAADIKLDNATAAKKLVPAKKVRLYLPRNPFSREDHFVLVDKEISATISHNVLTPIWQKKRSFL